MDQMGKIRILQFLITKKKVYLFEKQMVQIAPSLLSLLLPENFGISTQFLMAICLHLENEVGQKNNLIRHN